MTNVFISYAHADHAIATQIRNRLTKAGISVWSDREKLQSGAQWAENITDAIKSASSGLLLLSPASVNSAYVAREYQSILNQKKRLYVALVGNLPRREIPFYLSNLQYADLTHDFDAGINTLIESLQAEKDIPGSRILGQFQIDDDSTGQIATVKADPQKINSQEVVSQVKKLLDSGARSIKVIKGNDE